MPIYLKQSTASQEIPLGYFLDSVDGDTAETGLTIANTDIKVWKTGATTLASKNSGGATHISGGIYYAVLDATDTDTLGPLVIFVHVAGALAIRVECVVLLAQVYDSLIAGSDLLDVSVTQLAGVAQSLTDLKDFADDGYDPSTNKVQGVLLTDTVTTYTGNTPQTGDNYARIGALGAGLTALATQASVNTIDDFVDTEVATLVTNVAAIKTKTDQFVFTNANKVDATALTVSDKTGYALTALESSNQMEAGTAQAGSSSSLTLRSGASAVDEFYRGAIIRIYGGTGAGQSRRINGYVGSTKVATTAPTWATAPDNTSTYSIQPSLVPNVDGSGSIVSVSAVSGSVGSVTAAVDISAAGLAAIWNRLTSALTTSGSIGKLLVDNVNATISSRLASASITLTGGLVDVNDKTGFSLGASAITDFWATLTSALTTSGSIGKLLVDNINATISSRLASANISLSGGAVTVGTNSDKTGYALSTAGTQAIWDKATSALTTSGSIGKWILDKLDVIVSTRLASADISLSAGAVTVGTNSDKTGYALSSAGVDAILDDAPSAELASVPGDTATLRLMIQFLFQYFRFKRTVTSTTETAFKTNGSTSLGTATISDDGTTFTKGKMS